VLLGRIRHSLKALQGIEAKVGKKVRELRRQKGFTQDEFAAVAGLNKTHFFRLETGKQSMTLRTMKIIADALEVKVRDLVWDV
jgi:transcriptional regulator with XRE-family HTH domain